jgi:drug/metabolite transporter (DMT)-like permease
MSGNQRGIMWIVIFVTILPMMDAATKTLTDDYAAAQILATRFIFLFLVLAPPALLTPGNAMLVPPNRLLLLVRGALISCSSMFYVAALAYLPLATMAAITMLYPLIVTAVSPMLLGEKVGVFRYSAVVLGFIGAVIVLRPTLDGIGTGELLAIGAPVCFSAYIILTRSMSGQADKMTQLLWTVAGAMVILCIAALQDWQPITAEALGLMIMAGLFAIGVYLSQIAAFDAGEASVVVPFSYLNIVTAAVAGYVIWGHLPDALGWVGMSLIAISGIVVALRS